jgi:ABC-2 type transport system ATP-binding protein
LAEQVLVAEALLKNFGDFRAVDEISFTVNRGEVVGLLGPNGAGKTTTIHMLIGLTHHDGGSITYFGKDFRRNRSECLQRINFTSSYNSVQHRITVRENLRVFAGLYCISNADKKISDLVEYFEVGDLMKQTYWRLSAGQRTRVNLIKSLLNDPELLLMDEPTASLDPDIADKTLSLIERLRAEQSLSILYTSHNMAEVERICDTVVFLDHGRIVAHDTPAGLTKLIPTSQVRIVFDSEHGDVARRWLEGNQHAHEFTGHVSAAISVSERDIPKVLFGLSEAGVNITDIEIDKPDLEDVFLQLARHE